jgi:urease accessory protein
LAHLITDTDCPAPAASGLAHLTLAVDRPADDGLPGRTQLVERRTRPPLQVQRVLYLDEALPDMAFVCLCNPTAGVLQGDHLEVRVGLGPRARAHVSTQAATKVFTMPEGSARVDTCLSLDQGAWLEYLPEPLIPFRGARLRQETSVVVAPGASLVYGEVLASGRAAQGESLAYTELQYRLNVRTPAGRPIFHEAFRLTPLTHPLRRRGVLGTPEHPGEALLGNSAQGRREAGTLHAPGPAVGTLLIVSGEAAPEQLLQRVRGALAQCREASAGVSLLVGGHGVGVKVLARETTTARWALLTAWGEARRTILGVEPPPLRKY